uniref:Proteasome subunit alpha type n=1 Tax=Trichuris muris TaxID=70415 RepID=A0A5S6QKD6_TRIMR
MDRYDRAITIFSPDGHLFQVEYAQEAVKKGSVAIGVKGKDCVILAVEKKMIAKLQEERTVRKINRIDEHIIMAFAGLNADARVLTNMARVEAQSWRLTMEDAPPVGHIARYLANTMQRYTQSNGRRPFGVSAIVAGINADGTPHLFQVEPSGTYYEWKANCTGRSTSIIRSFLEKKYSEEKCQDAPQSVEACVVSYDRTKPVKITSELVTAETLESVVKEVIAEREAEISTARSHH